MFGVKNKSKEIKCTVCQSYLPQESEFIKIKRRYLFPDKDGIWHADHNVYVCMDCITELRNILKRR